ncbi:hypothetical protein GALL_449690 [mine drainage metagenome]|uniref:Uncharacterized protein n=1 Tax=mine drainage metagenome TaxID=410659 RepID=A0A1J5QBQ8_9ZZZZ
MGCALSAVSQPGERDSRLTATTYCGLFKSGLSALANSSRALSCTLVLEKR